MTRPTNKLFAIPRGGAARRFSGAFFACLPRRKRSKTSLSITSRIARDVSRFAVILMATLSFTACGLERTSPMRLESPVQQMPRGVTTFSTQVTPVAGRTPLLREVEKEVVSQMTALGYQPDASSAALTIGIQLQTTGKIRPQSGIVESGNLVLEMQDRSGHLLRRGRSLHLNTNDLDFMTQDEMVDRVNGFLDGIPAVKQEHTDD